jgi:hypothetical protein
MRSISLPVPPSNESHLIFFYSSWYFSKLNILGVLIAVKTGDKVECLFVIELLFLHSVAVLLRTKKVSKPADLIISSSKFYFTF